MISLTKSLPDSVIHKDVRYPIHTDFRAWLHFHEKLQAGDTDFRFLFSGEVPYCFRENAFVLPDDVYRQLIDFYACKSEIPHGDDGNQAEFSWQVDSDYIYGAFYQTYHIDLAETSMHWHKFMALFRALPDDTQFSQIISIRGYEGTDKDQLALQRRWSLPQMGEDESEFSKIFG